MRSTRVVLAAVFVAVVGCTDFRNPDAPDGTVCTTQFVYGLSVTVQDVKTGERFCDADISATSDAYQERLQLGSLVGCVYLGAGERPGVYDLTANKPGYRPAVFNNIRVAADACHVATTRVSLSLARE